MKDLPHHMKKLNRKVIRSENRILASELIVAEEALNNTSVKRPQKQIRKQQKAKMRKNAQMRTPEHLTEEQRNREMKYRVPVFDRTSNPRPKVNARAKKKTPPI